MNRPATKAPGDLTPVTGGIAAPARLLRPTDKHTPPIPADMLGKHILRLLSLHDDIAQKFRGIDLNRMDDTSKRALLQDINAALGILGIDPPAA